MQLPKLVLTDIDGVWTDGGMYYDNWGNESKKFNTRDSGGVLFLRYFDIPFGIITGENTKIVKRRAEKLKVERLYMGIQDKLTVAQNLCDEFNITLQEVAYIGDDINDYHLIKAVGLSACPADASFIIQETAHWTLSKKGGEGVFREFVERIFAEAGKMDALIHKITVA